MGMSSPNMLQAQEYLRAVESMGLSGERND
jgi:hypothetical protein